MLLIRQEQMELFETYALARFKSELVEHLRGFLPQRGTTIEKEGLQNLVELAIKRANRYSFTNRGPICSYLELMAKFGSDFDTDPQYPWLADVLNDTEHGASTQMAREARLNELAAEYSAAICGPARAYEAAVYQKLAERHFEDLPTTEEPFAADLIRELIETDIHKCAYLGGPTLHALIRRAEAAATEHAVACRAGVGLFLLLMFAFGHGCFRDVLYPWISESTRGLNAADSRPMLQKLHAQMTSFCASRLPFMKMG